MASFAQCCMTVIFLMVERDITLRAIRDVTQEEPVSSVIQGIIDGVGAVLCRGLDFAMVATHPKIDTAVTNLYGRSHVLTSRSPRGSQCIEQQAEQFSVQDLEDKGYFWVLSLTSPIQRGISTIANAFTYQLFAMAEQQLSQVVDLNANDAPEQLTDSGLWSAKQQQQQQPPPKESQEWHRYHENVTFNNPSDIELPPSPASSSPNDQDHDMTSVRVPEFSAGGNGDDGSKDIPPAEMAYPSPVSDQSMKESADRLPMDQDFGIGSSIVEEKREPSASWTEKNERIITRPFEYLMGKPGKSFRRQLLVALNVWTDVDESSLGIINRVVEMLHNASLLIDDIQDSSRLRRGGPAAHLVFGTAQTINAANYVYYLAQGELIGLKNWSAAIQIYSEELLNLHRGQGLDLYWRDTLTVPTEEEYMQMINFKTGGLFRLAARLLQSASSKPYDLVPLVESVGLVFQIRDDYQNLCSEHMASAKGYCDDLTEGKFSFPVVHSIRNSPDGNNELLNILKQRTDDVRLKAQAVWYMQTETDSFEYTKGKLRDLLATARNRLAVVGPTNMAFEQIMGKLSSY
ncbi:MAG: hypothetical protein Q9186_007083 [Xanthomendoza sp. 1 TL-2023]